MDYQTTKEFNFFSKDSVDGTNNTRALVKQFSDDTKLIVTTIQKLNTAISKKHYIAKMEKLRDKKVVFIFDECHRSQFGDTHKRIKAFFQNNQMFGFTGTPIFVKNAVSNEAGKRTTKDLFDECLHKYVITDAIRDENVLKFSIEYVGRYKQKEGSQTELDIKVEDIDTKELFESPKRLEKIADYILANHDRKTHSKHFTAMFCVNSVATLIKYYDLFKRKKEAGQHDLRIVTIFTYAANEKDADANGMIADPNFEVGSINKHTREKLDECIADYNAMFLTKHSTKDSESFYNYYKDIGRRIKDREKESFKKKDRVDILLVVNMFLTGFDAKKVNTLFVDKNLKYHGLVQAFSRTNRIIGERKSQGNIVCFRNLKEATDEAISLFADKEAKETILMEPYEVYVKKFNEALTRLRSLVPDVESVDELPSEIEEFEFVKAFRELIRIKNVLGVFTDFTFDDLNLEEQEFEDYKSKYLDIYDKVRSERQKEKVSILDDVDFELELIHRDKINVAYILQLLTKLKKAKAEEQEKQRQAIIDLLSTEVQLRSKRELIEKFIEKHLPKIKDANTIPEAFEAFWSIEKQKAFDALCEEEQLIRNELTKVIEKFLFDGRRPLRDTILKTLKAKPKILQRKAVVERVTDKVMDFVQMFEDEMGDSKII